MKRDTILNEIKKTYMSKINLQRGILTVEIYAVLSLSLVYALR